MSKTALMVSLVALTVINRGDALYGPGQAAGPAFECSEADAQPLLDCGAAITAEEAQRRADQGVAAAKAQAEAVGVGFSDGAALNAQDVANYRALAEAAEADKVQANAAAQLALNEASLAQDALVAEKARADALQAELDALKAAAVKPAGKK